MSAQIHWKLIEVIYLFDNKFQKQTLTEQSQGSTALEFHIGLKK